MRDMKDGPIEIEPVNGWDARPLRFRFVSFPAWARGCGVIVRAFSWEVISDALPDCGPGMLFCPGTEVDEDDEVVTWGSADAGLLKKLVAAANLGLVARALGRRRV